MAKIKSLDYMNLVSAIQSSNQSLDVFKRKRKEAVKKFVGSHYTENGDEYKSPINLIEMAIDTYAKSLIPGSPKVKVTTSHNELMPFASTFEEATNYLIDKIKLKDSLRDSVVDAMFLMGIVKIGLNYCKFEREGYNQDSGRPFVLPVDFDDFIIDMSADRMDNVMFIGNRYRMPLEYAQNSDMFDKKLRKELQPMSSRVQSSTALGVTEGRVSEISHESHLGNTEFVQFVELIDLWLPYHERFITIAADGSLEAPLSDKSWEGPVGGPYKLLYFEKVPSNLMPLPPVALWRDLHDAANDMLRKMVQQGQRQKTVTAFGAGNEADAARVINASDGEGVRVNDPNAIKEIRMGGVDQPTYSLFGSLREYFSYAAGNLDSIAGLGAQSSTFKQDQLIHQSASSRIAKMQESTMDFVQSVIHDMAWYLWTDPYINLPLVKRIDADVSIPVVYTQEDKEGEFMDYNISLDPYSMQNQTPESKVQTLLNIMGNVVYPNMQMFAQQGITVDMQKLLKIVGDYTNMSELESILIFSSQGDGNNQAGAGPIGTPPRKIASSISQPSSSTNGSSPGNQIPLANREVMRSQQMMQQQNQGGRPANG